MLRFLPANWNKWARKASRPAQLARIRYAAAPEVVYAIGDVHGCLSLLVQLEKAILADAAKYEGEKWIVMLGDYVDRGPHSAQVLDHLIQSLPENTLRICLAGNHETAMLGFLHDPAANSSWLEFGGGETLASYGISESLLRTASPASRRFRQALDSHIPDEHWRFLSSLPALVETPRHIFVHAGLRPAVPLEDQDVSDLLWIRDDFTETYADFGKTVVHGHTPRSEPLVTRTRIALDTGAYLTGRLTSVRLLGDKEPRIIDGAPGSFDRGG